MISLLISEKRKELLHYLLEPGHSERKVMLSDLDLSYVFTRDVSDARATQIVQNYVKENKRNFCQEGIARFVARFPEYAPPPPKKGRLEVVLSIDLEDVDDSFGDYKGSDNAITIQVANVVRDNLTERLKGRGDKGTVTAVAWKDYTASKS